MRLTMTEKILLAKLGKVPSPGDIVEIRPDFIGIHDILGPLVIEVLNEMKVKSISYKGGLGVFIDHASPPPSSRHAELHNQVRRFARRFGAYLADVGHGIMHQVIVEEGLAKPWDVVIASDSHTTTIGSIGSFATGMGSSDIAYALATGTIWIRTPEVVNVTLEGSLKSYVTAKDVALALLKELGATWANYKSVEFSGTLLKSLSVSSRMTLSNMMAEMSAKTAIFPADDVTLSYFDSLGIKVKRLSPEKGAKYKDSFVLEVDELEPLLALPGGFERVEPVSSHEGIEVDEVFIGSCTNGREEDFELVAKIIKGKKVHSGTRCIAIPASRRVFMNLLHSGVISVLADAGCTITYGTCGPCWGGHFGVLGPGEVALSTANRNFKGRMGDPTAKIFLASPATAAATAIEGKIADPSRYLR